MFATNGGVGDVSLLTAQQAQWLLDTHDWRGRRWILIENLLLLF